MKILPFTPKSPPGSGTLESTRLGFHAYSIRQEELREREHGIVVLGLADDTGIRNVGGRLGAKDGPQALRQKLYKFTSGAPRTPLYDLGDLAPASSIESTHVDACALVRSVAEAGHFPVVIGGGHDLGFPHALGVLEAKKKKFRFCNIDAHLDVRSVESGITSGSPWFLLREHSLFQSTRSRIEEFGIQPHCNASPLVEYAQKNKFGMHWLSKIKRPADKAFQRLLGPAKGAEALLVSLDIDSVQISDAPGCSAPQTLGFQASEVIQMSFLSGAHPRVASFGLFELSPALDPDGRTALLAAHCVSACIQGFESRAKVRGTK